MVLGIVIQIALTLLMFYSAMLFTCRHLKLDGLVNSLVAATVIVLSQEIFMVWTLGLSRHLWPVNLLIFNIVISAGFILLSRPREGGLFEPFIALGRLFSSFFRMLKQADILVMVILDFLLLAFLLFRAIVLPSYAHDESLYHLSSVGFMLQNGNLEFIPLYPLNAFPRDIEMTYYFNDAFVHHQVYLNCMQIPYAFLGVLASYAVMRKAGIGRHAALLTSLTLPVMPIILQQASIGYIDVSVSIIFLCGLSFLIERVQKPASVVLAGLALGIAFGGKGTMMVPVASAVILWMVIYGAGFIRARKLKAALLLLAMMLIAFSLNGAWIYFRNLAKFGNPVYPYEIKIGERVLIGGKLDISHHIGPAILGAMSEDILKRGWLNRQYYSFSQPKSPRIHYGAALGGFGPVFFVLFLPAILASFAIGLVQRNRRLVTAMLFFIVPLVSMGDMAFWQRYIIYFFTAGMVGFASIYQIVRLKDIKYLLSVLLVLLSVISVFFHTDIVGYGPEILGQFLKARPEYRHSSRIEDTTKLRGFYKEIYPAYMKPGTTIFVDNSFMFHRFLALWNNKFSNRIVFTDAIDREAWFKALEASGADYVVVSEGQMRARWFARLDPRIYNIPPGNEYSAEWIKKEPSRFRLKHSYGGLALYEVTK
jgi:hypothetical protein